MLQLRSIHPHTLELLRKIQGLPCVAETRLVGGTALALQFGHRQSIDLDFFGKLIDDSEAMEDQLREVGCLHVIKSTSKIRIYQIDGVKVDFVDYSRYPWIDEPVIDEDIVLASPKDIAAMKINAIEGRGTKKDFLDVFLLLQHYSLSDILDMYSQKYSEHSVFRALMSLTYFEDADAQLAPKTFDMPVWEDIKNCIISEANKLS